MEARGTQAATTKSTLRLKIAMHDARRCKFITGPGAHSCLSVHRMRIARHFGNFSIFNAGIVKRDGCSQTDAGKPEKPE